MDFQLLTAEERRALLWLARGSIRAALRRQDVPALPAPTRALCEPGAAFVSLHRGARLRGCIGTLAAEQPLHDTVARMARSAAFDDPRFAPLLDDELDAIAIEISRIGPLLPAIPEQVETGRHGVCLALHAQRAVFLPQVARVHGWNREMLLDELCAKALLPPQAWRRPEATLMIFEAEVFADAPEPG